MFTVILQSSAEKDFKKIDRQIQERILKKLSDLEQDPNIGIPLTGNLAGLWKLRIGDYRVVYQIKNQELIVLVLKIGHRKNVYE